MLRRDRIVQKVLRDRFVATMRNGETFDGLLIDADAKTFRLGNAFAVDTKGNRASVDGELFLPRAEVLYLQKPGGAA